MAVAVAKEVLVTDGDAAFLRVNTRVPPHALAPGEVAAATNVRFEQGKPRPRFGVALDEWGLPGNLLLNQTWQAFVGDTFIRNVTTVIGTEYRFYAGNAAGIGPGSSFGTNFVTEGTFTATETTYTVFTTGSDLAGTRITAVLVPAANTLAYGRFNDPVTGTDNGILVTDEWRSDNGRGRVWRLLPGNGPQEIDLNGHDVWGTARLVQCRDSLLLLRHGNERHYFGPSDLDGADDEITLHCAPSWAVGTSKRVRFNYATDGAYIDGTTPPADGNFYYARHFSGNVIKLYQGAADAAADTNELDFTETGALGKYFIELAETPAPYFGNGAPVLILETSEVGSTAFEVGWAAVRTSIAITNTSASLIDAENHKLAPGDAVTLTGITVATAGPYYAYPTTPDTFTIHSTPEAALTGVSAISDITPGGTGSVKKANASGLPLPPCREGAYIGGRFWGINEDDTIVFSDPNDFVHFTLYSATLSANQGEAGRANWIRPLGEDALVIGKAGKQIVLTGISADTSGWRASVITDEYGGIAALAATSVGTNLWSLARKGLVRTIRTTAGEKLAAADTVSRDIATEFADVDWGYASQACAATWNGRYFLSLPTKGQDDVANDKTLVLNFDNASLRVQQADLGGDVVGGIVETGGEVLSWEGKWQGDLLQPYAYALVTIAGEERLTFATKHGTVGWLHDGWDDAGTDIETEILTRGYFGGREMLVLKGKLNWDTQHPKVTVNLLTAGVNEEETLAGFDELEYDRTRYLVTGHGGTTTALGADVVPPGSVYFTIEGPTSGFYLEDLTPGATYYFTANDADGRVFNYPSGTLIREGSGYFVAPENGIVTLISSANNLDPVTATVQGTTTVAAPEYDPDTSTEAQFSAPYRQDYSPSASEVLVAQLDLHQNVTEPFRCRERGTAPQLRITNVQGSLRLASVSLQARPVGIRATRKA